MDPAKWISGFVRIISMSKGRLTGNWEKRVLAGLFGFLWFFYGAMADRIFPAADTILVGILNPLAYQSSITTVNLLVLLFPFISFALVLLVHYYWEQPVWFGIILLCVFFFDTIVGLVSSKEIHDHLVSQGGEAYEGSWSIYFGWPDYFAHVSIVILCGFLASFVAGLLYHAIQGKVNLSTDIVEKSTDIVEKSTGIDIED